MVEVDVFWTFGIGALFATAAYKEIRKEREEGKKWYETKSFLYNLLFHSVLFVPSGVYLLWANTGWETMYMLNKNMPAIIPCLFAMTNILFAILGYRVAYGFVVSGKMKLANLTWMFGWGMMLFILLVGWKRFLYAGTFTDWNGEVINWFSYVAEPVKHYRLIDFFSFHIFYALIGMGIFFVPAIAIPLIIWLRR